MYRGNVFWALVLILAGALLLLNNFDIIDVSWELIWPAFLILLGAWFLFGRLLPAGSDETHTLNVPLEGAVQARVKLEHGAGRLDLHGAAAPGELLTGSFGPGIVHTVRRDGDTVNLNLRAPSDFFFWMWPGNWGGQGMHWDFGLTDEIPLSLDFSGGASENVLNLSALKVTDLKVSTGASSTVLTLPANAGFTDVKVESGAASVEMDIPQGVAARITISSGLAGIDVNTARFPKSGGIYQSPDYDSAANKVAIQVETGVGSVKIR